MRLESKKYLRHIERAAGLAGEFLTGRSFHDILIHGYADVDHRIVWEVATVKVPALAAGV